MPPAAYRYSVPESWYKNLGVRRYGFHGTSHLYVSKRAARMLGKSAKDVNLVTLHIGSGASACAIKNGVSHDTSMGMTPLAGMSMGTRTGDIDPGVVLYVMERLGLSPAEMTSVMGKESGHVGLCGISDRRDLVLGYDNDNSCQLALDIEAQNAKKYIGAYSAELGRVDAVVFTAGVGENNSFIRSKILSGLENIGIVLDDTVNKSLKGGRPHIGVEEAVISTPDSKVKIFVIPTNEERVIIEDTLAILNGTYNPNHLEMSYSFI
jgi:acetate kinase